MVGAGVLYLTSFTPLRRWLQRIAGLQPPAVPPAAAAAAVGVGENAAGMPGECESYYSPGG